MKTLCLILVLINPVLMTDMYSQEKGSISLEVKNILNEKGTLRVGLFNENDKFLKIPSYSKDIPVNGEKSLQVDFKNIPFGTYAISIYHDLDDNGELDSNFFGIPKEPVAFSNDHKPKMGPPQFKGAAFDLSEPQLDLTAELYNY